MNLNEEFKKYLKYIGLDEKTMHPEQMKYTRKMFYYSIGYFLETITDATGEMSEEESLKMFDSIRNQVLDFLHKVLNEYN